MRMDIEIQLAKAENLVPQTETELKVLRKQVAGFLINIELVAPLHQEMLIKLATEFIFQFPENHKYIKLIAILINNAAWQPVVASVPFDRRVLLLPKCIRNSSGCAAEIDELGLLCQFCGGCKLEDYIQKGRKSWLSCDCKRRDWCCECTFEFRTN
jgi:geranylgeranyl diphosphate synthase type II